MNYHHKKLLLFIFSLICLSNWSYAQTNLVLNPSFEQGTVPTGQSQLHLATNWTHYKGECIANDPNYPSTWPNSDLFDRNSTNPNVDVPFNIWTTSAGLDERTGQNRYAGIASKIDQLTTDDERIRGAFSTALQAGNYDLSLYLARAKNHFALSNPNLDPVNRYIVEILLRKGTDCSVQKLIYTSPNITNYQWQQYATTFSISASEANIYNRVEIRLKNYSYDEFKYMTLRSMFIDDVSISPVVCNLNPAYSYSVGCDKKANQAVIDVIGNVVNPNSQWNLYRMNVNSIADQDIDPTFTPIILSGHQVQFRVPNVAGKYYMIKHGVWTNVCPWAEQRRVFQIPTFNDYVNSDFSGTYNSPSGTGTPSIQVTASDPTNPISNWLLFSSSYDAPITPSLSGWNFVTSVGNTNTHTFNNLQNGTYYLVRHNSKHNCSQYGHTYKKFYGNIQRMANNTTFEAIDSNTGTMTEEEYKAFEKMMQQEAANIQNPVKLYPNPATSVVNITANTLASEYKVTITNQYGKQMYEGILSKEISLNIATWRKGLYFVNVHTPDGIKVEKLLVE